MRRALLGLVMLGLAAAGLRTTSADPPPPNQSNVVVRPGFWSATDANSFTLVVTNEDEAIEYVRDVAAKPRLGVDTNIFKYMADDLFGVWAAQDVWLPTERLVAANTSTGGALWRLMQAWLQWSIAAGHLTAEQANQWIGFEREKFLQAGAAPALVPEGL